MESEQDAMITEKVSSTASENRKSSKPIMEKRRRARINASLAQLKSLLLEVMKKEGSRQNKMEKADILEITVRHLRQLQKQQFSALAASDPSMINKYRLGFNECASEVGKFLGSMEGVDTEARAKLLGHLANCMVTSESSSTNKCSSKSPTGILDDFSEDCWRKSNCVSLSYTPPQTACTNLNLKPLQPNHLTYSPPQTLSTNCVRNGILDSGINLPSQEQCVTSTVSSTVLPISNTNIPMQSVVGQQQIPSNQPQIQQTIIQQPSQSLQIPKIVSGVQVIPTKMSTGEMAFIIPANILASGQTPNYVIPFLPSQGLATTATTTHAQFPTATMAPLTIIQPTVAKGDIPLNNLSSNTSVNHLSESKPMTTICQTDNLLTENGSPSSTISRKNFNENRFDIGHVTSQPSTIRSQESVNGHNSNIILQSKDNDMWRPW